MITVFTAVHLPAMTYLSEAYASLVCQTHDDWEWVIAFNGGALPPPALLADRRIRAMQVDGGQSFAKAAACHYARGSVLVKLDADDLLARDALATVAETQGFAYGNFAPFQDCTWNARSYTRRCGWYHKTIQYKTSQGYHRAVEHRAWNPGPLMIASLMYAPCCLMAWERETYRRIGGYDLDSPISPEHELLCKTYLECGNAGMVHHDKCLSYYRIHKTNTSLATNGNGEVKSKRLATYEQYVAQVYGRWCTDNRLLMMSLDASWGKTVIANDAVGLVSVDEVEVPWDELHRVMMGGGIVLAKRNVPRGDSRFQRVHHGEGCDHFVCLKPPYSDRPVGEVLI